MESYDENEALQLKNLLRCPGVENLGITYAYAGGGDDLVTDANKEHFVKQKIFYNLIGSRLEQLQALRDGFWKLSPIQKPLKLISWRDVVVLLCGHSFISWEMLWNVLVFEGFEKTLIPQNFKEILTEMSQDELRKLLYFVTEQPSIPFGGINKKRWKIVIFFLRSS